MPKIFIPAIGTEIKLAKPWDFALIKDHLNKGIFETFGIPYYDDLFGTKGQKFGRVSLPEDTVLKVDRIYIRKGLEDYDYLTFYIISSSVLKTKKTVRFFAKLADVNSIEYQG